MKKINTNITLEDETEIKLTAGEKQIVRALYKLEELWIKYGKRLILFNGNSLRVIKNSEGSYFIDRRIFDFEINGDGGDGGDYE